MREGVDYAVTNLSHYDMIMRTASRGWDCITWVTYRVHRIKTVQEIMEELNHFTGSSRLIIGLDEEPNLIDRTVIGPLPNLLSRQCEVRLLYKSHLKYVLFEAHNRKSLAILTTKNFGEGDWLEYSCLLTHEQTVPIKKITKNIWRRAMTVDKVMPVTDHVNEINDLLGPIK